MNDSKSPREFGEREQRRLAVAFTALLALVAAVLLPLTPNLITSGDEFPTYRSPALLPIISLTVVAVCGALHTAGLARGAALATDDIDEPSANWPVILVAFAAYAAYIAAVPIVGYMAGTASFIVLLGVLAKLGWRLPLILGITLTGVLYAVFVIGLKVWFPAAALAFGGSAS